MRAKMKTPRTGGSPSPVIKQPRPRKRKGRPRNFEHKSDSRGVFALRDDDLGQVDKRSFSGFAPRVRGAKIRNSKRWIDGTPHPSTGMDFPFFDKLGRYTGTSLFRWAGDSRSFVASAVATVASRLHNRCAYYNKMKVVERNMHRIVQVAAYYVFSKNSYFWDRILFFTKNLEKNGVLLHKFMLRYVAKTDANKRFVYGHVCSQTQWLLFRAERPRDKSAIVERSRILLQGKMPTPLDVGSYLFEIAKAISNL